MTVGFLVELLASLASKQINPLSQRRGRYIPRQKVERINPTIGVV